MNVSSVSITAFTSATQQSQKSNTSYSFTEIMGHMRSQQSTNSAISTNSTVRAAEVRAGLDAETLAHLDKYAEIYNKYAAIYGDGFEIVRTQYGDGSASDAEEMKRIKARLEFNSELNKAGIPGATRPVKADEYEEGSLTFLNPTDTYWKEKYNTDISSLFYAEKYGLAGLTKDEQCQAVLSRLKNSTVDDMAAAAQMLYNIGAISAYDSREIHRQTSMYAGESLGPNATREDLIRAQRDTLFDWSGLLAKLKGNELSNLLSNILNSNDYNAEDKKLQAIYKKVDAQQESIHEAIEYRAQKQRENELLDRAAAEGAHLRALFGLANGSEAADTAVDVSSEL